MNKKMKTSDIALIVVAAILALFTIAMIVVFCMFQHTPDTLIMAVFACLGTETGALAWIRTSKLKHGYNNDDDASDEIHYKRGE